MPAQAQLFVGVPINIPADLSAVAKRFGVHLTDPKDLHKSGEEFSQAQLTIQVEGQPRAVELLIASDEGYEDWGLRGPVINTITGQGGDSWLLVGVDLTSRYFPSILDAGWPHGRPDPFVLDLERLTRIRNEVREQWPEAEIILQEVWY